MAVEYAKVREQFGRAIGSFQAVKHMCAEMVSEIEPARSLVWYAAYAYDHEPRDAARAASMAKARLSDVYSRTTNRAVQIHGGIGFTWEHDMHLWFKRAQVERSRLRRRDVPSRAAGAACRVLSRAQPSHCVAGESGASRRWTAADLNVRKTCMPTFNAIS